MGLAPKPYALREFLDATSKGFALMPGGLAKTVNPDATVALSAPDKGSERPRPVALYEPLANR
jgi:hypothetical protein